MPELTPALLLLLKLAAAFCAVTASADDYTQSVQPYIQRYCVECHNSDDPKGELDLTRYVGAADVTASFRRWNNIIDFIRDGEMPPEDASQPSIEDSNAAVAAIEAILLAEARKNAGDPGNVLPRRLSNTEFDTTVRELTGVDIRPTKDFPADPAGGEGFDNTGEALRTSPNLVKKYLAAAQLVADHLVLKPDGVSFAPFPVTSYNERKKLTEQAIIDFYEQHSVNTLTYVDAAWRYRHRSHDRQTATLEQWAAERGLSQRYLTLVWQTLSDASARAGFLGRLGALWDQIPAPRSEDDRPAELLEVGEYIEFGKNILFGSEQQLIRSNAGNWPISHLDFRASVAAARDKFAPGKLKNEVLLNVYRVPAAGKNQAEASTSVFLRIDPAFGGGENYVIIRSPQFSLADRLSGNSTEAQEQHKVQSLRSVLQRTHPQLVKTLGFGSYPTGDEIDADSFVVKAPAVVEIPISAELHEELAGKNLLLPCQLDPQHSPDGSVLLQYATGQPPERNYSRTAKHLVHANSDTAAELNRSADIFCHTFPSRFFYVDDIRGLAAGFHLVEGFFRDDLPLVNMVLSEEENAELDRLWRELNFVTQSTETLLRGFVWFERSEREVLHDKRFDFLRPEDPDLITAPVLDRFEKLYLDKMGVRRQGDTLEAEVPDQKYEMIHGFFNQIRDGLKRQTASTEAAERKALTDIEELARRAFRRSLTDRDRTSLHSLYRELRAENQSVEASLRGLLTAVLMSPDFCYHWTSRPGGAGIYELDAHDLASRLSFFLWSSLPDSELLGLAESGRLRDEEVLVAQTRRMLKDVKVTAFSREFFGQWLRYRDYLSKDPIQAAAFPGYTDELRSAIFEEPVRLATYLIQTDRPVTDLLNSDVTFVNSTLARHYGEFIYQQYQRSMPKRDDDGWSAVTGLREAGRGGLFGMAVTLAKNSAGQRTSPVKRGFWTVHHLLGQHFPPPPANVPELPASENAASQTIRQLLAAHVADAQCAMCHTHFDGLGLAMEGFDPIGRAREVDAAGRRIDNMFQLPNGRSASGISGLIDYIVQERQQDFIRTMCRRFLGYALGRSVILSDQPLLSEMEEALQKNEFRISILFECVVRSPQFRTQRGRGYPVTTVH